jgi:putative ABC transport system ATP-binding protein
MTVSVDTAWITGTSAATADDLRLSFGDTHALRGASLAIQAGEVVALMGPSGSGKSTLLHCLAGILRPDSGTVTVAGKTLDSMSERQRSDLRLRSMGFVFQDSDLIPELTLAENVALPLQLLGVRHREARRRASEALAAVGLDTEADRRTGAVSGGQAQRAAVARALVHEPAIVFADEPTGALDTVTGERTLEVLLSAASERSASVLLVTHDHRVSAHADRLLVIRDGVVLDGEKLR